MGDMERVDLTVFGEALRLRVNAEEVASLREAADYLQAKLDEFSDMGGGIPNLRLTVLAGLDIAHELIRERNRGLEREEQSHLDQDSLRGKLEQLLDRLDEALDK